jgi:hypothetical protein
VITITDLITFLFHQSLTTNHQSLPRVPLRHAIRPLLKSHGFTITAILILGFGIGANTAIFSLIDAVLLKPLPFPHPERLVAIYQPYQDFEWTNLDYPDYQDFCAAQHSFESLAALKDSSFDLSGHGDAERLYGYFSRK